MPVHSRATPSIKFSSTIYTPGCKEALWELSVLLKNTIQCPRPGLEPGQLAPANRGVERTNHEVTDFQGVILNSTGAEVQNEQREQGGGGGDDFCQEDITPPLLFEKFDCA